MCCVLYPASSVNLLDGKALYIYVVIIDYFGPNFLITFSLQLFLLDNIWPGAINAQIT